MRQLVLIFSLSLSFILNSFGQTSEEYYQNASKFYDNGDYKSAIEIINKALVNDLTNSKYLLLKGNILEKSQEYQKAFDVYTFSIKSNPAESYAYNQRGLLLIKVREPEFAIDDFSSALEFEKNDSLKLSLLVNRSTAKIDIRNFQSAYEDLISALKLDTLNIGVLNNLATVCDEVGKGDQTLKYLYKIIDIDSTFIGAYGNIGFKYQEMGDYKTAIKFFNKVLELAPNDPLGYSNRAYNKYKLNDYKTGLSDINKSISLYPANSYAFRIRALIYLALKKNQDACNDIDEALRLGFTKMYGEEVEQLKKQYCK